MATQSAIAVFVDGATVEKEDTPQGSSGTHTSNSAGSAAVTKPEPAPVPKLVPNLVPNPHPKPPGVQLSVVVNDPYGAKYARDCFGTVPLAVLRSKLPEFADNVSRIDAAVGDTCVGIRCNAFGPHSLFMTATLLQSDGEDVTETWSCECEKGCFGDADLDTYDALRFAFHLLQVLNMCQTTHRKSLAAYCIPVQVSIGVGDYDDE
jgi:hypothetical protein